MEMSQNASPEEVSAFIEKMAGSEFIQKGGVYHYEVAGSNEVKITALDSGTERLFKVRDDSPILAIFRSLSRKPNLNPITIS